VQLGREGDEPTAPATRAVLGHVLDVLLRLLHPTMPFVTETLWTALTGRESVVVASWPTHSGASADTVAARRVADLQRLVTEVRRFRADQGLRPTQKVAARLTGLSGADLDPVAAQLLSLARLDEPGEGFAATASIEVRLSRATVQVELDTSGTVDLAAERRRLDKELAAAEKELATTTGKLGSAAFVGKAPDDVVAKIRARQSLATEEIERVTARLAGLGQG
jgi:valyl-tRNA synthetase